MLLHEILQYESLEFVLGLEIDQRVTRKSFQYFGTQPHWDNDKVQWWYGDAAKSLLLLPKEYFGTFDLVLVDLSETVMSLSVTDNLNIFEALSLLLKPDGIIVKNEIYLEDFAELFPYTMQMYYYQVPIICSQAMVFGSYANDYLIKEPIRHEGINVLLDELKEPSRFHQWHDYRRNSTSTRNHCKENESDKQVEPTEQGKSPGIMMILEAENVKADIDSAEKVIKLLKKGASKAKLTVIDSVTSMDMNMDASVDQATLIMKEGYVNARAYPRDKYIALDLHMWGRYDRMEQVKAAFLAAVKCPGGSSSSSYRIIAGGMFGVDSWKYDELNRGPRKTLACDDKNNKNKNIVTVREGAVESDKLKMLLQKGMELRAGNASTIALVVCGSVDRPCESIEAIKQARNVDRVVPIFTCPEVVDVNEFMEDGLDRMKSCKDTLTSRLASVAEQGSKFGAIILDTSSSRPMGQLIHFILNSRRNRVTLLDENILMMTLLNDLESEEWRRNLLERFRRDMIRDDPVSRAQIWFNSTTASVELGIAMTSVDDFTDHMYDAVLEMEQETGLVADIRSIQGGMFRIQTDYGPTQPSIPQDYEQEKPYTQWLSQKPLAIQVLAQFEFMDFAKYFSVGDRVQVYFEDEDDPEDETENGLFEGKITDYDEEDELYSIAFDDGDHSEDIHIRQMTKLESSVDPPAPPTTTAMKQALNTTLSMNDLTTQEDGPIISEFDNLGEGCLLVSMWKHGSVVLLWDGRDHVDLNIFLTEEENFDLANAIQQSFEKEFILLNPTLTDEQPRGTGRVVNFSSDLTEPRIRPAWAW